MSQTDSQNTPPSVLTEIKSNLYEKAENFSFTEMQSDLCFMIHPIEQIPGTREMCLKYTVLFLKKKEQYFTLLMRDITHHSQLSVYPFIHISSSGFGAVIPIEEKICYQKYRSEIFCTVEDLFKCIFRGSRFGNTPTHFFIESFESELVMFVPWLKSP